MDTKRAKMAPKRQEGSKKGQKLSQKRAEMEQKRQEWSKEG